jgi:hypothetical protein
LESMECESRVATWMKMIEDCHKQRYLATERLFVRRDVRMFDGNNHVFHVNVIETSSTKEVQPCIMSGEDGQLVVVFLESIINNQ